MPASALPLHFQDTIPDREHDNVPNHQNVPFSAKSGASMWSQRSTTAVYNLDSVLAELRQANHDVSHMYEGSDEDTDDEDEGQPGFWHKVNHYRARMRHVLHLPAFHYTIIGLVILDMIIVFIDLVVTLLNLPCLTEDQVKWFEENEIHTLVPTPNCKLRETSHFVNGEWFLWAFSVFLLSIFVLELIASGIAFGFFKHFKRPIYAIDAIIVVTSLILEIYFKIGDGGKLETAPSALIALRLWKIVRAVHAIAHSIELRNQTIIKKVKSAKAQVEASLDEISVLLEREQLKITFLKDRLPGVSDEEMEQWVDKEMEGREKNDSSDIVDPGEKDI